MEKFKHFLSRKISVTKPSEVAAFNMTSNLYMITRQRELSKTKLYVTFVLFCTL